MPAIDYSFAGRIGRAMTAIFALIGFNWQICIALIPGMAAGEVAVSSLATVYALSAADDDAAAQALTPLISDGWSLATALSLPVWFIYAPRCISTLATISARPKFVAEDGLRHDLPVRAGLYCIVRDLPGRGAAGGGVSTSLLLQYAIIAVAVLLSVWVVAKKQFPGSVRRLRVAIALPLLREGKPAWLRSIGLRVSPVARTGDSACGGCDGCGPSA